MTKTWEVVLVRVLNMPRTVCVAGYSFDIVQGKVEHNEASLEGARLKGPAHSSTYRAAYSLAHFAHEHDLFDRVEDN